MRVLEKTQGRLILGKRRFTNVSQQEKYRKNGSRCNCRVCVRANANQFAQASISLSPKEFSDFSLNCWEIALGDACSAGPGEPPVSLADIETVHHLSSPERSYSELFANVDRRRIVAHNITFYRVICDAAFQYIHTCGYKFRLPYTPEADANAEFNGQTIEGGIFVWDGGNTRLDYGMAFQWIVNPWLTTAGDLNVWTGSGWQKVDEVLPLDQEWHEVNMTVDYPNHAVTLLVDNNKCESLFTATTKSGWGPETAARLQVEAISKYPEPEGINAIHKVEVKDWHWTWEPASTKAFLPLIAKAEPPTLTPTPTATSTPTVTPTATATPSPTPTPPVSCGDAFFTDPEPNETVCSPFDVCWVPSTCRMELQAYQNGLLVFEEKNARSCMRLSIGDGNINGGIKAGYTELKMWVPGAYNPQPPIWITITPC